MFWESITKFLAFPILTSLPVPSWKPWLPLPTKSLDETRSPENSIFLILWFSRTYKLSEESKTTSFTPSNLTSSMLPLLFPHWPSWLANLVKFPWVSIFEILLFHSSATYMFPEESNAIPTGPFNSFSQFVPW